MSEKEKKHSGSKYLRTIFDTSGLSTQSLEIDVYCVLEAFHVNCPARQHAMKKLLCAGLRKKNTILEDLKEAKDAIDRAIQLEKQRSA